MPDKLQIIERQNNALHQLNEIAAISDISPLETLRKALEIGKEYFGLEFGIVSHIVGEDYTVDVQSSPPDTLFDGQLFELGSTYCKTTLEIDDVLAITDVTKSKYIGHPCHRDFNLVSYIGAPIRVNSKVYGTINFSSAQARHLEYNKIDDEFMKLLSRWAGSFLERQSVLDELSLEKQKFEMIFENNASGTLLIDDSCQILMTNKRFCEIIGFSKSELVGQNAIIYYLDDISYNTAREKILNTDKSSYINMEHQLKRKDGKLIWCKFVGSQIELTKDSTAMIWSILDITAQKEMQEKLEKQATMDYLTELYNRRYFTSRLEEEVLKIKRDKNSTTSLMIFDLDKFKQINDTLGHLTGDFVLKKFADIIKKNLRKTDIAGRVGGEEFAMILPNTDITNASILANRIREEVSNKIITIDKKDINFTVSIGLTALSYDDINSDSAFARADNALYMAKAKGRNRLEQK
ncbi:MAG: diguanylate cyclase [Sulfurimonas sp. RIFOXYD12_FULL_33_39]|uniref:sensor domain-containing diguanylate cyclase n=1 Tax=unclassified Sulfurimonas TaxID=2623549 RepID=UPI0008D5ADB4|nr:MULTISPECIES: diguanylate cyclase [unclassified Sulfurimonas]OHE05952.1 MAG: diguanylate cyclase [Sulfurimonas sp. RIFCSPLOWO2_12_FULL_34_6]OHE10620.1 MAG: diguanylate cyclase [Sulfurimonas sp. RIFOXYD12_FULL_33_39]OHE14868.1 MAG: diguanylate cyclase [Sulfurimonas sp. RIFOXYD2_FULL_34_21]